MNSKGNKQRNKERMGERKEGGKEGRKREGNYKERVEKSKKQRTVGNWGTGIQGLG